MEKFIYFPCNLQKKPYEGFKYKDLETTPKDMFSSPYIGILTGQKNNITVVDIDQIKDKEIGHIECGMKAYNYLLLKYNNNNQLDTLTIKTKNNGLHLYFQYEESITQTTKFNNTTIDTRNNGGYCCFSNGSNNDYGIIKNEEILKMPEWLKKWLMQHLKTNKPDKPKSNNKVKTDDQLSVNNNDTFNNMIFFYDTDVLKNQLSQLPDSYFCSRDSWFKITMAMT